MMKTTHLLKRQMISSEREDYDKTAKKIKNVNKSYEENKLDETGVEAEEMETIEKEKAAVEVESKDDGGDPAPDVQENNLIQFAYRK